MAPELRESRTPSARAVAAERSYSQALQPPPGTSTRSRSLGTGRSKSQPNKVIARSKSTSQKKKTKSAPRPRRERSSSSEDSPSQGRGANKPPPSGQPGADNNDIDSGESTETEVEEIETESMEASIKKFDSKNVHFDIRHDIHLGAKFLYSKITPWLSYNQEWAWKMIKVTQKHMGPKLRAKLELPIWGPIAYINVGRTAKKLRWKGTIIANNNKRFHEGGLYWLAMKQQAILKAEKLRPIDIEVVWRWELTSTPFDESDREDSPEQDEVAGEDSTQTRRRKSKKKRRQSGPPDTQSSTQRQRVSAVNTRQIEAITGDNIMALNEKFACRVTSCSNHPKPCVVVAEAGPPSDHLPLNNAAVKKWNQLIRDGVATTDDCPPSVVNDLLEERRRMEIRKASKLAVEPSLPGHSMIFNFGGPGGAAGFGEFRAPAPAPQQAEPPRSSPPQRTGDDDENMKLYMS